MLNSKGDHNQVQAVPSLRVSLARSPGNTRLRAAGKRTLPGEDDRAPTRTPKRFVFETATLVLIPPFELATWQPQRPVSFQLFRAPPRKAIGKSLWDYAPTSDLRTGEKILKTSVANAPAFSA